MKKKSGILVPKTYYQEILSLLFEDLNETERMRKIDYLPKYEPSTTPALLEHEEELYRRYGDFRTYTSRNKRFARP